MENYKIGLIFVDDEDYTDKAYWCNEHNCYIEEIEAKEDGTRQFQIKQCEKIEEPIIKSKSASTHTLENAEKKIEDLQTEISQLTARIEELEKGNKKLG